jgi:DNA-binding PadR family transcriptional regulator
MAAAPTPGTDPAPPTPALHHVLLALLQGERHGYAIMQDIERITDGAVRMGPGTLYGAVKRLLEAGLIEEAGDRDDPAVDERRRYYRISGAGRSAIAAETARLRRLVDFAHDRLRTSVNA